MANVEIFKIIHWGSLPPKYGWVLKTRNIFYCLIHSLPPFRLSKDQNSLEITQMDYMRFSLLHTHTIDCEISRDLHKLRCSASIRFDCIIVCWYAFPMPAYFPTRKFHLIIMLITGNKYGFRCKILPRTALLSQLCWLL